MRTTASACVILAIALVTVTALGCASTGGGGTPVAVKDVSALAGTWTGWVRLPTGGSVPGTLQINPGGAYAVRAGAFNTQGQAQVKDGGVVLVSTAASGPLAASDRTSTGSLAERAGVQVLRGAGRDATHGPFEFEFTRQK
jgi:hypothetical protein